MLELLAAAERPMTVREIAAQLGVGRSIAYRLLRTHEAHRLVHARPGGGYELGSGLLTLGRSVQLDLRAAALPIATRLSERLNATVSLVGAEGDDVICLLSVEPRRPGVRLVYREGLRHSIHVGALGRAILSAAEPKPDDAAAVVEARSRHYAKSVGEVEPGTLAIAVPVLERGLPCRYAIGALFVASNDVDETGVVEALELAAAELSRALG